jgi:hypothetical protein
LAAQPVTSRRWLAGYAILLMVLTSLPYLVGFGRAGTEWHFTGFVIGVDDGNSYLAKMLLGSQGDWLFRTPYTTMAQDGALVFIPFLLLGKLAGGPALHLQLVGLFHLLRLAAIPLVVVATHRFAARFTESHAGRGWVTVVATLGGGLGWILLFFERGQAWGEMPLAFISPETFGFLALYAGPHLALARGLMLLALAGYLTGGEHGGPAWGPGLLALATFMANPLTGVSLALVVGAHQVVLLFVKTENPGEWRRASLRLLLPAAPYVLYLGFAAMRDPFLQAWAVRNQILSPPPGYYLLAYGLLLPLAAAGLGRLRQRRPADWLPVAWLLITPLLAYAPVGVQRRLPEGAWVALAVLALWGLERVKSARWRKSLRLGTAGMTLPAAAILLLGGLRVAAEPAEPAFTPADRVAAYQVIAGRAQRGDVVLASFRASNELPAWAPVRVPIGHGPESIGLEQVQEEIDRALAAGGWVEAERVAGRLGASWLLSERTGGASFIDDAPPGWHAAGEWGDVVLFKRGPAP